MKLKPMKIDFKTEEMRPSTLPSSASFDPSNPLGFLEKVFDFIGKESNFLKKDSAENEIITVITAAKEKLKMEEMRPSTLAFSASFDPSNPLGFLEKVFDFIGKESNFLKKDSIENEIITAITAAKEKLKMKKYGLQIRAPSQKKQSSSRPPLRPPSIFADDDENDVEKEISKQASKTKALKEIEGQHKKTLEEDPFAFAYDDVFHDMKQKAVLPRMQDCKERKPRYIQNLKKQAERREKEQEIVYERKLAKERVKEEHLFSDKEKFVTGPYKRKLEDQKKWLAKERLRELREEKDDVTKKKDLSDFYFNIGKNVAFEARDIKAKEAERHEEQRKAEKLEELRKEETREVKKRKSPEKEASPESEDIGSSCRRSVEPQAAPEKIMGSDERDTNHHKKSEDAIAAAKERFLVRKRAKIDE